MLTSLTISPTRTYPQALRAELACERTHTRKLIALQHEVSGLAKEQGEAVDQLGTSLIQAKQRETRYKQKVEQLRRRQWNKQDEAQMQVSGRNQGTIKRLSFSMRALRSRLRCSPARTPRSCRGCLPSYQQEGMKAAIDTAVRIRTNELEKTYATAVNNAFDRDIAPLLRQARHDTKNALAAPFLQGAAPSLQSPGPAPAPAE